MSKNRYYQNCNQYQNGGKKRRGRWKTILSIVACCLLAFMLGAFAFSVFSPAPLNDKNLLKYENYVENRIEKTSGGLKVRWDDDGSFTLSGKHEDASTLNNSKYRYTFASVKLSEGTYVLTTNNDKCSTDKYGMYYTLGGETHEVLDEEATIVVGSESMIEIGFFVKNNERILRADFEPVLVVKGDSTEFRAEK